ncbi:MAG TPA: M1 family metallopeptidase [Bacteroidales bacterium]|nr:M1 family metallopeptidase [Bacteroidales bacterium]
MKKIFCLALFFTGLSMSLHSQIILTKPLSPRQTGYKIDAALDTRTAIIHGKMRAFWVNFSNDPVEEVQMHLYLNAFRNSRSTFMKESGTSFSLVANDSGYVDIITVSDSKGSDLLPLLRYISPDDGNSDDKTVVSIKLPDPCKPRDTVWLNMEFDSRLPGTLYRTGHTNGYYFAGQWFPKFGVYETSGMRYALKDSWNCHQFHRHSEFYSNHSVYEVNITIPSDYVVGTGGLIMDEKANDDSTKTISCRAEDIVDFAWVAWTGFNIYNDKWNDVAITFLYPSDHEDQVQRQVQAVKFGLEYLAERVGPYPWPHLTFVDPPTFGTGSAGMEYTTLFTTVSVTGIPEYLRLPQLTTIHEFGHAYFMGIFASNEFEEPWMDEGMNTYWESRIIDHFYGIRSGLIDHPLMRLSDKSYVRMNYVLSPDKQLVTNAENSWSYPPGTYSMMSYQKTGVIFNTLEGITGTEITDEIFREYYKNWAFKHPSGKDFIEVANKVYADHSKDSLKDLNWFFSQTLFGTDICDYKVSDITNTFVPGTDSTYKSIVRLQRLGGIKLPVEVLVTFNNGEKLSVKWDGRDRYKDLEYTGNRKVKSVAIDPGYVISMDVNYINNSMTVRPDRLPLSRFYIKLISFIQFFISILFI